MNKIIVLGAGIAGISAGYHAALKEYECDVYEAEANYGGLCDCFNISGFRFDNAVHLSFSKDEYVRPIFDQTPYKIHKGYQCYAN